MKPLVLSDVGATPAVPLRGYSSHNSAQLPPGIFVTLSDGAELQYVVEATADRPSIAVDGAPSVFPDPGHWAPLPNWAGMRLSAGPVGLSGSAADTLPFMVHGIRARVVSHTSGTLSFQVAE